MPRTFIAAALAVFVSIGMCGASALAAPDAASLGPEVAMAQPAGSFIGKLSVEPAHGPVGTAVTAQ